MQQRLHPAPQRGSVSAGPTPTRRDALRRPHLHQRRSLHQAVEHAHSVELPVYDDSIVARPFFGASPDYAVWFPNLLYATDWTLHDSLSSGVRRDRGYATGELWNSVGTYVATVTQGVLLWHAR